MAKNYIGTRFGELVIVAEIERIKNNRRFTCQCDCGSITVKYLANLTQGKSRSCGCGWVDRSQPGRDAVLAVRLTRSQESDDGRVCLTCDTWKPWSNFSSDVRRVSGKSSNCMQCGRWRSVKAAFGITKDEWMWLFEQQGRACAMCEEPQHTTDTKQLSVDHDHECCGPSGACPNCIRGLLCTSCNLMLGYAVKTEANRLRFTDYLKRRPFMEQGEGYGR